MRQFARAARVLTLACAATLLLRASAQGQENAYDLLGKTLVPLANVFAPNEDGTMEPHAMVLDAHLLTASGLPPALQGQSVHVAIVTPDKVLVQAPIAGELMTICRDGDSLWATPGSKIQSLLSQAAGAASDVPGKKKKKLKSAGNKILAPLELPFPQREMALLPILFQVADAGSVTIANTPCRALDVQLMPQLSHSIHADGWSGRLWIAPDYHPAQIALKGPDWSGTIAIDKLTLPPSLPPETFQPVGSDVLHLTGAQFADLISRVGRK